MQPLVKLFGSDNFSRTEIAYRATSPEARNFLQSVLGLYFQEFEIKNIEQLDGAEINSNNYKVIILVSGENQTLLVRKFKSLQDRSHIDFVLNMLDDLDGQGVPVSAPRTSLGGKFFVEV